MKSVANVTRIGLEATEVGRALIASAPGGVLAVGVGEQTSPFLAPRDPGADFQDHGDETTAEKRYEGASGRVGRKWLDDDREHGNGGQDGEPMPAHVTTIDISLVER
jgi:hypothetical protein